MVVCIFLVETGLQKVHLKAKVPQSNPQTSEVWSMQQNARSECPKCSRPLQKFNGHIGYCPQHKWVSPIGLGFEAEAAEQNR